MAGIHDTLALYLHLARASQQRRRPFVRDKLLLIAGAQAVDMGLDQIGDYCRHKILTHNPGHLLRHFPTLAAARDDESFLAQLRQVQRAYPREKVEHMLDSLGIELGRERDAYFSDHEYAASLLGTTPEELEAMFGESSTKSAVAEANTPPVAEPPNDHPLPAETLRRPDVNKPRGLLSKRTLLSGWLTVFLILTLPMLVAIVLWLILLLILSLPVLIGVIPAVVLSAVQWNFRG